MSALAFNIEQIAPAWNSFHQAMPALGRIRNEEHYDKLVEQLNALIDIVGDNETHPLASLLEVAGKLIEDYDAEHHNIPEGEPKDVLQFLMESNALTQSDLSKELGGQSVVSDILHGRRQLNIRQAKALASRFNVAVNVFI
ncbi:helix-turn-helix domain-containing protein [Methylobacillus glycogenes]|uniref:helix-turn-helix domain-containing protein n=1 Tax=Methylobacillus glycogenes TaxID=406 RepID=UPI00046EAD2C|nr:helix-turn-helix domain-containing protein [Methylobacillus glycogenes]